MTIYQLYVVVSDVNMCMFCCKIVISMFWCMTFQNVGIITQFKSVQSVCGMYCWIKYVPPRVRAKWQPGSSWTTPSQRNSELSPYFLNKRPPSLKTAWPQALVPTSMVQLRPVGPTRDGPVQTVGCGVPSVPTILRRKITGSPPPNYLKFCSVSIGAWRDDMAEYICEIGVWVITILLHDVL